MENIYNIPKETNMKFLVFEKQNIWKIATAKKKEDFSEKIVLPNTFSKRILLICKRELVEVKRRYAEKIRIQKKTRRNYRKI